MEGGWERGAPANLQRGSNGVGRAVGMSEKESESGTESRRARQREREREMERMERMERTIEREMSDGLHQIVLNFVFPAIISQMDRALITRAASCRQSHEGGH